MSAPAHAPAPVAHTTSDHLVVVVAVGAAQREAAATLLKEAKGPSGGLHPFHVFELPVLGRVPPEGDADAEPSELGVPAAVFVGGVPGERLAALDAAARVVAGELRRGFADEAARVATAALTRGYALLPTEFGRVAFDPHLALLLGAPCCRALRRARGEPMWIWLGPRPAA